MKLNKPIYGMNFGSVGFLMNDYKLDGLEERLNNAQLTKLRPLVMKTLNPTGQEIKAIAINEISIRREKYQAAKIQIMIDNEVRIEELVCDGVILSTAAGSTGYNYSASGPIIPLGSNVVALTAVSAYSPRHWRGGLLKDNAKIKIINNNPSKRPIVVHADHIEAKDVISVEIEMSEGMEIPLLFDIASLKFKKLFKDLMVFSRESKEFIFLIFFKDSFLSSIIFSKTLAIILIVILSNVQILYQNLDVPRLS